MLIQALNTKSSNSHVVIFPHAGSSPFSFNSFSEQVCAQHTHLGVNYPGRGALFGHDFADDIVNQIAAPVATHLASLNSDSIIVFGHSMGGLIAYETVRILEQQGVSVEKLIISSISDPISLSSLPKKSDTASDEDLIRLLKRREGLDAELLDCDEMLAVYLEVIRGDMKLVELYHYSDAEELVACPVELIFARDDEAISHQVMSGWIPFFASKPNLTEFHGGHFFTHNESNFARLSNLFERRS